MIPTSLRLEKPYRIYCDGFPFIYSILMIPFSNLKLFVIVGPLPSPKSMKFQRFMILKSLDTCGYVQILDLNGFLPLFLIVSFLRLFLNRVGQAAKR